MRIIFFEVLLTLQSQFQAIPAPARATGGLMSTPDEYSRSVEAGQVAAMLLRCGPSLITAGRNSAVGTWQSEREGTAVEHCFVSVVSKYKPKLQETKDFQGNAVKQYNPDVDKDSSMMFLKMSPHDEVSTAGIALVVIGLLLTVGLVVSRGDGKGYRLANNALKRTLFLYGDRLSIINVENLVPKLMNEQCRGNTDDESATVYLEALSRVRMFPGDLHILMHMLALVYGLFYGGFLQPFQAVLRWKRIQMDTIPRHAASLQLANIVYEELQRLSVQQWVRADPVFHVRAELRDAGAPDARLQFGIDVSTSELAEYRPEVVVDSAVRSYQDYMAELRVSEDPVVRATARYMRLMADTLCYEDSTRRGDVYTLGSVSLPLTQTLTQTQH